MFLYVKPYFQNGTKPNKLNSLMCKLKANVFFLKVCLNLKIN